jgi:hypothetical protein
MAVTNGHRTIALLIHGLHCSCACWLCMCRGLHLVDARSDARHTGEVAGLAQELHEASTHALRLSLN